MYKFNLKLFSDWANHPIGNFPIMEISCAIKTGINSHGNIVMISPYTFSKQLLHHPDLQIEDYSIITLLGSEPLVVLQNNKNTNLAVLVGQARGPNLWLGSIKAVQNGMRETFLTSFRRTNRDDLFREMNKGRVLLGSQPMNT